MKKTTLSILLILLFVFSSCEKSIINEDSGFTENLPENAARLSITTRSGDANSTIKQGRIYIFNQSDKCIHLLSTDESDNTASVQLATGSYSLYAIGGEDLTRFNIPTQSDATTTSVISRKEGKVMEDFLMKKADISVTNGEDVNQNIALEHKVLCISKVEIKNVPDNVSKVEVTISPLYSTIQLDGTYPSESTESYKIALSEQNDGTTWSSSPDQMLFPSKGAPTVKISMTTDTGIIGYSYTTAEELPANHHFTITGTFVSSDGFKLTGILTAADWGEDRTIDFNFDDNSKTTENPIAGQYYNDYYVISVNTANRTALLLAKKSVTYTAPSNTTNASLWDAAITESMGNLEKPSNIDCGSWRLPTSSEADIFLRDQQVVKYSKGYSSAYFCKDGNTLKFAYMAFDNNTYTFYSNSEEFASYILLRPVIDITF